MHAQALAQPQPPPGEGDPTDNAVGWYKHLNNEAERQPGELRGVRCATFALGNRQYEHFCYMGRWMDARLVAYGATRLCALGEGDDDDNLEADFERWKATLWEALCPGGGEITCAPTPQFECKMLPKGANPNSNPNPNPNPNSSPKRFMDEIAKC